MDTPAGADDEHLVGAEIQFGPTLLGHVEGVVRDPLSGRVRKVITTYGQGAARRRVAMPIDWVVQRTPTRLVIGVGALSLDDLADQSDARHTTPAVAA
jgi:hypothetical protein